MKNYSDKRYVFIDTETGGIIPGKHSLLSIGIVIWEKDYGIIDKKEFYVKNNTYVITKEAQKINKFDRIQHEAIAEDPNVIIESLITFIGKYFPKNTFFPLAGHNIQFDINFLKAFLSEHNRSFNQYFSHRAIDTYSIYKALVLSGKISDNINSSHDAFAYFNISVANRHNALDDCIATVELFEKMLELITD